MEDGSKKAPMEEGSTGAQAPRIPEGDAESRERSKAQKPRREARPKPRSDASAEDAKELDREGRDPVAPRDVGTEPRALPQRKLYQDEIYGSKELSPLAVALMDSPEFQRLGHIYQLGTTYLVFRGGNHRRIDHCVGTYFMSRTIMRRVVQNHARLHAKDSEGFCHPGLWVSPRLYLQAPGTPADTQVPYSPMGRWRGLVEVVSAAALLHDIGHIPVGHTLEDEFSVFRKHDGLGESRLFELLYGPRARTAVPAETGQILDRHFGPIDEQRLPRPRPHDLRVPLPWTFEGQMYQPFLPEPVFRAEGPQGFSLSNSELRDLIYLILSFKEKVTDSSYQTFGEQLDAALAEAGDDDKKARLEFISELHRSFSESFHLHEDLDDRPLFHPFMADIVGNTICADLLDYLVRDGKRLNLEIRNNPRLQRYLVIRPESSFARTDQDAPGSLRLTIQAVNKQGLARRDTVSDLLDLMRERYRFAEVVYYHPKKCAFSAMFAKALELSGNAVRDDGGVYPAPWTGTAQKLPTVPHVTHVGDDSVLAYLASGDASRDERVRQLGRQLTYRDEYRLLFTVDHDAAQGTGGGPLKLIRSLRETHPPDEGRREWERRFADLVAASPLAGLVGDAPPVLIYCPNIRMQAKEVAARVELKPGLVVPLNRQGPGPLHDEIRHLNERYRSLWRLYLFVHPSLTRSGLSESELLFAALIDSFSSYFDITVEDRERGARIDYVRPATRMDSHLGEWLQSHSAFDHEAIRAAASDQKLWTVALGREETAFPVTEAEFDAGFSLAAAVAAADQAPTRVREEWAGEIQDFRGAQWCRRAPIERVNRAREAAVARLAAVAEGLSERAEGERRRPIGDWTSLVEFVGRQLGRNR